MGHNFWATLYSLYHTVFVRGFATTSVATNLILTYSFPHIWLSEPGGCIDPTELLAECQRRYVTSGISNALPGFEPTTFRLQAATTPPIPNQQQNDIENQTNTSSTISDAW